MVDLESDKVDLTKKLTKELTKKLTKKLRGETAGTNESKVVASKDEALFSQVFAPNLVEIEQGESGKRLDREEHIHRR